MSGQSESRRGALARLRAELRGQDCTYREIAACIRGELRVNARVAFRMAHGWTQTEVAERWNAQWPDQEAPKTAKQISYWENWPAPSGRAPALDTLDKLAFLYQCSAADLLDGQDYSHLDPAAASHVGRSGRLAGPAPAAAAGHPSVVAGAAGPAVVLPDPAGVGAAVRQLVGPEQFATQLAGLLGGLVAVADGTLGLSARQRDAARQQLVDLFRTWAPTMTMNRRSVFQVVGWAATAMAAGPAFTGLDPDDQERLAAAIQAPSRVDGAVLDQLEQMLRHCIRLDDALGPQAVLDTVLAQRQLAAGMLAECPSARRPRLLSVYADLTRFAGVTAFNLNDFEGAAYYYEQARTAAYQAQDIALGARVLLCQSQLAIWQQQPHVGIDHAVAAQSWVQRTDDLLLRAWAADIAAEAYALDGQQAACLAELDTADAGLAAAAGRPSIVEGRFAEGLHSGIRGECLLRLHRPTEALQAAERSLAMSDHTQVRNVAICTVDLGLARLEGGDLDHAVATFEQAADLAVQNRSARLTSHLHAARARMQPWQDSPAVIQLDQRLRAYQLV